MSPEHFHSFAIAVDWVRATGIGALLGWGFYRSLGWNTGLYVSGSRLWLALSAHVARMGFTALVLYACARLGVSLPALLIGMLVARQAVVHGER